jgi:shikimate kinase
MNIVLIGYRCSGKSSSGRIIAKKTGRTFIDTDKMIEEKAGSSIEEIVRMNGWEYFRGLEKEVIKEVSGKDNLVIATGGGVVIDEDNVTNLKKNGFTVWLKADINTLKERVEREELSGNIRPSLTGLDILDEVETVLASRNPLYKKAGDLVVETDKFSIKEVANLIIKEMSRRQSG